MSNIRKTVDRLFNQAETIRHYIEDHQKFCPHITSVYKAEGSTGNYDRDDSFWFTFYCYDCRKRWCLDQSLGHGNSHRVEKIEYDKKPEIIELEIKIEGLR